MSEPQPDAQDDAEYGIADDVLVLLDTFLIQWPHAEYGPAHIVLSDQNIDDYFVDWCLDQMRNMIQGETGVCYSGHSKEEIAATVILLEGLRAIPEERRFKKLSQ